MSPFLLPLIILSSCSSIFESDPETTPSPEAQKDFETRIYSYPQLQACEQITTREAVEQGE